MQTTIAKIVLNFFDYFHQRKIFNYLSKIAGKKLETVFDIGAHKGETVVNFKKFFKVKNIFSFEPSKKNFKELFEFTKNFSNVKIYNFAFGSKNEKKSLNYSLESSSSTINSINQNSKYYKLKKKLFFGNTNKKLFVKEIIKVMRIDNFLLSKKISSIDILKIDTEGFEFEVIKGLGDKIICVKIIYFEHHYDDMVKKNYTFCNIHDHLKNYKFKQVFKLKMPFRKTFEYIYINEKKF